MMRAILLVVPLLFAAEWPRFATQEGALRGLAPASGKPAAGEQNVSATMSVDGVELRYAGPAAVKPGAPIRASLQLVNGSSREVILDGDIDGRPLFWIVVRGPGGKVRRSNALALEGELSRAGGTIPSLNPGKGMRGTYDLNGWIDTSTPGVHNISLEVALNAALKIPGIPERLLRVSDVPIEVLPAEGGERGHH